MAISLKEQLRQAMQINESTDSDLLLYEAWVKSGEEGGEYWWGEPQTGGKPLKAPPGADIKDKNYYPPHINVLDKPSTNAEALSKSTRLFYDFYALSALKDMVGTPRYEPKTKMAAIHGLAQNVPGSNPYMVNFADTNLRMMGGEVPEMLRNKIDKAWEVVVKGITQKLLAHLRLTLIQEFRYLIGHAHDWQQFRQHLVSLYNKNQGKISKEDFEKAIAAKIPGMKGHSDAVKRIMLFCKYYKPTAAYDGKDPATALDDRPDKKGGNQPKVGSEPEKEPEAEPEEPKAQEPSEPDDTDYNMPSVEVPQGADYDDDSDKISNFMSKYGNEIEKAKLQKWFAAKKQKLGEDYAAGRISPSTVRQVFAAMHKSGMTWQDVILGYENLDWGAGVGAGLIANDPHHPGYGGARWGVGVEEFLKLVGAYKKGDSIRMAELVDHIYDLQHNSANLLNKGGMWVSDKDLDRRAVISSLPKFLPNVSPFVKRMILTVIPYLSKHPEIEKDFEKFASSPTKPFTPEQEAQLTKAKFAKSPSDGSVWVTQAPFKNKKDETVQRHFILKQHTNGLLSLSDSMNAEGRVFDNFEEAIEFLKARSHEFVIPQHGAAIYKMAADSAKDNYLASHVKIKLDAAKETKLLEECKMAWRPSNSYYKAYMPGNERFQFFAFNDGTFIGCLKNKGGIEFTSTTWDDAFQKCKQITANALPNDDYDEGKAYIGLPLGAPPPQITKTPAQAPTPSVGSAPQGMPWSLSPIEANMLQILGQQKSGVTWKNNVPPDGFFVYEAGGKTTLMVGKKAQFGTGKTYKVVHIYDNGQEDWQFSNWNATYNFIAQNFGALTQVTNQPVKSTVGSVASVTPQIFQQAPSAPPPQNATSKAAYKMHLGIDKPPTHTLRLTVEDEQLMTNAGFEVKMVGTDPWYIHKQTGDTVKFYPNNIAKIMFIKTNNKVVVSKTIDDALAWIKEKFSASAGAMSPISAPAPSTKGQKAGGMYEKIIADAGFVWDDAQGLYVNPDHDNDTLLIKPFPKSTLTYGHSGAKSIFNSLPQMAAGLVKYAQGVKKKVVASANPEWDVEVALANAGFKLIDSTHPGEKQGKIYIKEPEGTTFTLYPDGSGFITTGGMNPNNPNKDPNLNFPTAEKSLAYIATLNPPKNLTDSQKVAIKTLAASYNLGLTEEFVGKRTKVVPYLAVRDKNNTIIYTIRKVNNIFMAMATKDAPGGQHTVASYADWKDFWEKLDETFSKYASTQPEPEKHIQSSKLTPNEVSAIHAMVAPLGLKIDYVEPEGHIGYANVLTSWGSSVFGIQKFEGMYRVLNTINQKDYSIVDQFADFKDALASLQHLVTTYFGPQGFKLTDEQIHKLMQLATEYHFHTNQKLMGMEPDGHPVLWLEFIGPDNKVMYVVGKDNENYVVHRVFVNSWDKWVQTTDFDDMYQKLKQFLHVNVTVNPPEHDGITEEEYNKIRDTVDSYGDMFETHYNKGVPGQQGPYCTVTQKTFTMGQKNFYVQIGALGNYYQINGPAGNALYNVGTIGGILEWLNDKLSSIAGAPQSIPSDDMSEIIHLMQQYKFNSASPGGGANNNYLYVKDTNGVDVNHNNYVTFYRHKVFGPIRHKPAKAFIQWFKNVYAQGQLPPDGHELAARIINGLSNQGFVNKDSGQVIPHQKINAIKWFRAYIMNLTGGECGLAKSKWAIENLETFLAYVVQNGLPALDTHGPDKSGLFHAVPPPYVPNVPTTQSSDLELTDEEQKEIAEIFGHYAPFIKFQIKMDKSITMWFGDNVTSYKIDKVNGTYKVYGELADKWEEVSSSNTLSGLKDYLFKLCQMIKNVSAKSQLVAVQALNKDAPITPSSDPNKLSVSEVKTLKLLADQFKITAGTYQKKKLNEAKQPLYAQVILSDPHNSMWMKVHKFGGKYHFEKTSEFGTAFTPVKTSDTFEGILNYIDFYINGYLATDSQNDSVLNHDQFQWLDTLLKSKGLTVTLMHWSNGTVGGYDPHKESKGSSFGNPLFVIRPSNYAGSKITVQVQTKDDGMGSEDFSFNDFQEMSDWIIDNLDTMTQLMDSGPMTPEGKLPQLLDKLGFEYLSTGSHHHKEGETWYHYKGSNGEKIYIGSDGKTMGWFKNQDDGEVYQQKFDSIKQLVQYLETGSSSGSPEPAPVNEMNKTHEYLAYLGFATGDSLKGYTTTWLRNNGDGSKDYVRLDQDGGSKVTPSSLLNHDLGEASPFYFDKLETLRAYLTEKYKKGATFFAKYLSTVLIKGGMKQKEDPDAPLGHIWWRNTLTIVPFESGGQMFTPIGVDPKVRFSYQSTYDLARRVELWLEGDQDYQDPGWSTGDGHLDELLVDAGFDYVGHEDFKHAGQILIFKHENGTKLRFHTSDSSASITFTQWSSPKPTSVIAFDNPTELKDYIQKFIAAQAQGQEIPGHAKKAATDDLAEQSILEYGKDATDVVSALKYMEQQGLADSVAFQFNPNGDTGEIRVIKMNLLLFSVGKKQVGTNELWYVRQSVNDAPNNQFSKMEYSFMTSASMVEWIKFYAGQLSTWKTVKGADGSNLGTPTQPTPSIEPKPEKKQPEPSKTPGAIYYPQEHLVVLLQSKGFKAENMAGKPYTPGMENVSATHWVHPSKFNFTLHNNCIVWHYEKGTKEVYIPLEDQEQFLVKALKSVTPDMTDDQLDLLFSETLKSREEKLFDKMLKIAENLNGKFYNHEHFHDALSDRGFFVDDIGKFYYNDEIYQVVVPVAPEDGAGTVFKLMYIDNGTIQTKVFISEMSLFDAIGEHGSIAKAAKPAVVEKPKEQYAPSGESYKTHDNEANASLIWLNQHDEAVLDSLGFIRVPEENRYYKNNLGDIIKFRDTGKADFYEYAGKTIAEDTYSFDSIPHALRFLAVKYTLTPFSNQDYDTSTDPDQLDTIKLNHHDTYMLEQLGFKWDEKDKKYIKLWVKGDKPKGDKPEPLNEAKKKKKKKDPNQPEFQFDPNPPEDDDSSWEPYHEELQCFDSGHAIWDLLSSESDGNSIQTFEGPIHKVLQFIWMRWKNQLKQNLIGMKVPEPKPDFDTIPGVLMEPTIHQKFVDRGFEFDHKKREYHKKVENIDNLPSWVLIKYDGTNYHLTYPTKQAGKLGGTKYFPSTNPHAILNKLKSLENADYGLIVTHEADALQVKDSNYFNAPPEWTKYNPYAPVVNPGNIKPESWIHKELEAYGFEWNDNGKMYWYHPIDSTPNEKAMLWEAVRCDKNGTFIFFYPGGIGTKGERRYFCSKDFNEVEQKIENAHLDSHHGKINPAQQTKVTQAAKPNNGKLLDAANYPKAADPTQHFSQPGKPMKAVEQDHLAFLKAGFKYLENAGTYMNSKTKDQFKIFSDGNAWYQLVGTGTGVSNDLGHFFDMLKSKYGVLEWGDQGLTGHEINQIDGKLNVLGFSKVQSQSEFDKLVYRRKPEKKETTMNVSEEVAISIKDHSLRFYLMDGSNHHNVLGYYDFQSITYALQTIGQGAQGIPLRLGHELDTVMHQRGFLYNDKTNRYASTMKVNGLDITITFYGDGISWAQAWKALASTDDMDLEKEIKFDNFFNAIHWAASKDINSPLSGEDVPGQTPEVKPIQEETVNAVMSALGMSPDGKAILGNKYKNADGSKRFMVNLGSGKVVYDYQYVSDALTGELKWGQAIFKNWDEFDSWLADKTTKVPSKGDLPAAPLPTEKKYPVLPKPMPWSNFDYDNWAVGKGYSSNSTISLMPEDEKIMTKLGWKKYENDKGTIYYENEYDKTQFIYFYVSGKADSFKGQEVKHWNHIKSLVDYLWSEAMQANDDTLSPDPTSAPPPTDESVDVDKELIDMGFQFKSENIELDRVYIKKIGKNVFEAIWHHNDKTIEFVWGHVKGPNDAIIIQHWTEDEKSALKQIEKSLADMSNQAGKKPKKVLAGTADMPWSNIDYKTKWAKQPTDIGLRLEYKDEQLMKKLGWDWEPYSPEPDENSFFYRNGEQTMKFLKTGKVLYWSQEDGQPTQTWDSPEDAVRWLWKNWKESGKKVPYSGKNYVTTQKQTPHAIQLNLDDGVTLAKMGFHKEEVKSEDPAFKIQYTRVGKDTEVLYFLSDGKATYWVNGHGPTYFNTIEELMQEMWNKYGDATTTNESEVPWSHQDYKKYYQTDNKFPDNQSIILFGKDLNLMEKMGFKQIKNMLASIENRIRYQNGEQVLHFYANGTADYANSKTGEKKTFGSIQDALQFLWDAWHSVNAPKSKVTGIVPFSGTDYYNEWKDFSKDITHHLTNDHSVMMKMGFKSKIGTAADGTHTAYYVHPQSGDQVYFFSDAHAMLIPQNNVTDIKNFKTVKDCLQFLWDKYVPTI